MNNNVAAIPLVTAPDQDAWITFDGTAGNRFMMDCGLASASGTNWEPYIQLYDPSGGQVKGLYHGGL